MAVDLPGHVPAGAGAAAAIPDDDRTGGGSMERTLALLDGVARRPVLEHPEVYEAIHSELQRALAGLDDV